MKKNKLSQSFSITKPISNADLPLFDKQEKKLENLIGDKMNITITRGTVKKVYDTKSSEKGFEYTNFIVEVVKSIESKSGDKKNITTNINFCKFGSIDISVGDDVLITGELSSRKDGDKYSISIVVKSIEKLTNNDSAKSDDYFISSLKEPVDLPF